MNSSTPRIDEKTSLDDLAHLICGTLAAHGIDAVLSGGAVVSLYTHNGYLSYDLDFITSTPIANIAPIQRPLVSPGNPDAISHTVNVRSRSSSG